MIKFYELDAYKTAKNVGYCTCAAALHNGMIVSANLTAKTVALPTTTTAKGDVWLVMNRIDKPEILKPNDYTIEIGEFPRIFNVKSLNGKMLDLDTDQVATAYASISAGDKLTADTAGKLAVTADVSAHETYFEVIEKNTFGGTGLRVLVVDNTAAVKAAAAQAAAIAAAATAAATAIAAAAELPATLGTAGQVLTVNTAADGVEWKTHA
jgi:hypothetical protein